jgi:3-oxoadipate enol-lactonase
MSRAAINGITIHYKVQGRGTPLVLIGGFDSPLQTWGRQTAVFSQSFKVIAFDARGTGRSSKPAGSYSIAVMAEDVIKLLDFLKIEEAHFLGVSLGGLVAQEIAIRYPRRVGKLVLGTTFSQITENSGPTPDMYRIANLPFYKMLDGMAGLMLNRRLYRSLLLPVAYVKNRLVHREAILQKREAAYRYDSSLKLPQVRATTLILTGTADRVILPSSSDILRGLIAGSTLIMVEGGSHLLFIEKAEVFNRAVLDFLLRRS